MPSRSEHGVASRLLVTFGTSLTAERTWFWRRTGGAWVSQIRAALAASDGVSMRVSNRAKWGADSTWGLRTLSRRVLALRPDLVSVEFAVNDADVRRSIPLETSRSNLERLVDRIVSALPTCRVVVIVTNPVFGRHFADRPALEEYYAASRQVASERDLKLLDLYPRWIAALRDEDEKSRLLPDGIHPSEAGSREIVAPAVMEAISE